MQWSRLKEEGKEFLLKPLLISQHACTIHEWDRLDGKGDRYVNGFCFRFSPLKDAAQRDSELETRDWPVAIPSHLLAREAAAAGENRHVVGIICKPRCLV